MPYSKYIDRVHALGESIERATNFNDNEHRSALCNLITEIPTVLESEARRLCEAVECPTAIELVLHLQSDIDKHSDKPEYAIVFYPLMRVAIALRTKEVTK